MRGLAPSVVFSARLGVELAFRLDETRGVDLTPPVVRLLDGVVSVFWVGDVKTDFET